MLTLNLAGLSNSQLRTLIWSRCKFFGQVEDVAIHRRDSDRAGAYALVDMSCVAEVRRVLMGIGDMLCGQAALIRLSQVTPVGEREAKTDPRAHARVAHMAQAVNEDAFNESRRNGRL